MSKFNPGVKVLVIGEDNEVRYGVIQNAYDDVGIAIVKFTDDTVEKVHYNRMGIEPETVSQEINEPVEKTEITITEDYFKEVCVDVIAEKTVGNLSLAFSMVNIVVAISKKLFSTEGKND